MKKRTGASLLSKAAAMLLALVLVLNQPAAFIEQAKACLPGTLACSTAVGSCNPTPNTVQHGQTGIQFTLTGVQYQSDATAGSHQITFPDGAIVTSANTVNQSGTGSAEVNQDGFPGGVVTLTISGLTNGTYFDYGVNFTVTAPTSGSSWTITNHFVSNDGTNVMPTLEITLVAQNDPPTLDSLTPPSKDHEKDPSSIVGIVIQSTDPGPNNPVEVSITNSTFVSNGVANGSIAIANETQNTGADNLTFDIQNVPAGYNGTLELQITIDDTVNSPVIVDYDFEFIDTPPTVVLASTVPSPIGGQTFDVNVIIGDDNPGDDSAGYSVTVTQSGGITINTPMPLTGSLSSGTATVPVSITLPSEVGGSLDAIETLLSRSGEEGTANPLSFDSGTRRSRNSALDSTAIHADDVITGSGDDVITIHSAGPACYDVYRLEETGFVIGEERDPSDEELVAYGESGDKGAGGLQDEPEPVEPLPGFEPVEYLNASISGFQVSPSFTSSFTGVVIGVESEYVQSRYTQLPSSLDQAFSHNVEMNIHIPMK